MRVIILCVFFALTTSFSSQAQEGFLGEIRLFAGNFAPRGWAYCDGQQLPINQYQSLYAILGTTYGGDGRSSFALPKLTGPGQATAPTIKTPGNAKSMPGGNPLTATFRNTTTQAVNAYWVDWDGNPVFYGTIEPLQTWTVNSGTRQYWRFNHNRTTITTIELEPNQTQYDIKVDQPNGVKTGNVRYIICVSGFFPSRN